MSPTALGSPAGLPREPTAPPEAFPLMKGFSPTGSVGKPGRDPPVKMSIFLSDKRKHIFFLSIPTTVERVSCFNGSPSIRNGLFCQLALKTRCTPPPASSTEAQRPGLLMASCPTAGVPLSRQRGTGRGWLVSFGFVQPCGEQP